MFGSDMTHYKLKKMRPVIFAFQKSVFKVFFLLQIFFFMFSKYFDMHVKNNF